MPNALVPDRTASMRSLLKRWGGLTDEQLSSATPAEVERMITRLKLTLVVGSDDTRPTVPAP